MNFEFSEPGPAGPAGPSILPSRHILWASSNTSISSPRVGRHLDGAVVGCSGRKRPRSMPFSTRCDSPLKKSLYLTVCVPSLPTLSTLADAHEYLKFLSSTSTTAPTLYLPSDGAIRAIFGFMNSSRRESSWIWTSGSHVFSSSPVHLMRNSDSPVLVTRTSRRTSTSAVCRSTGISFPVVLACVVCRSAGISSSVDSCS
mmetsp:Transcript_41676/g.97857  ORF Transcript_41676/g.97857 Transcript_41676/m.97857 type:complete len:200 (+) Transcript_41676:179-778(+)